MNELIISKAAVAHNAAVIRSHSGRARIIGVVKGNGYGVGTAAFAQLLTDNGAEILAAASLDDALTLRRSGFTQPLLLMSPLYDSRQLEQALQSRLILTLASRSGVAAAEQAAAEQAAQEQTQHEEQASHEQQQPQEQMVWIPQSGSKYHSNSSCSGMNNPTQITISEAQSMGYEPCKKCY